MGVAGVGRGEPWVAEGATVAVGVAGDGAGVVVAVPGVLTAGLVGVGVGDGPDGGFDAGAAPASETARAPSLVVS